MFCPECQAEYRSGFKTCSDCHVDLVETLPEAAKDGSAALLDSDLQEVWTGKNQEECVMHCSELRNAKIPYEAFRHQLRAFADADGNYRIAVLPKFVERARKVIEHGNLDDGDDPGVDPEMELAAQDDKPPTDVDDEHLDWSDEAPDDATVEVATAPTRDVADMMVLALRESDIESRITILPDGARKIFVTPHDESRAREIVREVESGDPPE
jgi:hypothetical protein